MRSNDVEEIQEAIMPYFEETRPAIAALDRRVSGEERFFQLMPHLTEGFVFLEKDKVAGFYLPTYSDGLIMAQSNPKLASP